VYTANTLGLNGTDYIPSTAKTELAQVCRALKSLWTISWAINDSHNP